MAGLQLKDMLRTVEAIVRHPLMPSDVSVRGFIIDSATGELAEVNG